MIKNVIFDIGNVLMQFTWRKYIHTLFLDEETIKHVNGAIWHSGLWNELDRGVMLEEDIFHEMRNRDPKYKNEVIFALQGVAGCFNKVDYAIPWIKEVKKSGRGVYFLSNYSPFAQRCNPECLDFLPYMDGGIFSCDVKHIKPDKAIYKELCNTYHLKPEECIFIDDNEANVKAAIEFGMRAIQFTRYEETKVLLDEQLKTED